MANYSLVFSPTGGTKKVADILANALWDERQEIDLCRPLEKMSLESGDVCLVALPSARKRP